MTEQHDITGALEHAQNAIRQYQSSKSAALTALRALLAEKPETERPALVAWMRSQPLLLCGFTFPVELLDLIEKEQA